MADFNPICVILVAAGPNTGAKLLFRYPFETETQRDQASSSKSYKRTPYAVKFVKEDHQNFKKKKSSNIENGNLVGFTDEILANLLAVSGDNLCDRKFDIKIDDVRFVGFPKLLRSDQIHSFNVVFVIRSSVAESVVSCCHDLARQLTVAVKHEENRCQYLSRESKIMLAVQDEVSTLPEDCMESPFRKMLQQSTLARTLKSAYESLCSKGVVHLYINRWIQINFCLPHKIYAHLDPRGHIEPEAVWKCLSTVRPYHSVLLLVEEKVLLDCLPIDCTPTLPKLLQVISPLKSLQSLALDADLSLSQVFRLVTHLVYWGKAFIIYPLCKSNVYVISPHAQTYIHSPLSALFAEKFPGMSLLAVLSEFSLPTLLDQPKDFLCLPQQQKQKVQMVIWMLQHQLLLQLHTYVYLMPKTPKMSDNVTSSPAKTLVTPTPDDSFQVQITSSYSDVASANSDDSTQRTSSIQMSKSPSMEAFGDVTEEMRNEWRVVEWVMGDFTQTQRDYVRRLVSSIGVDDFKLFIRLCPYFNGKHHLEEIMYYENVRRSPLVTLLDKLREILVTCMHHDPASTFYTK